MLLIGFGDQPILTPDGITHLVRVVRRNGMLSDRTSCGIDWRRTGAWPPHGKDGDLAVDEHGDPIEVDCMACIADETRP
jgi:hypothetical protein